MPKVYVKDSGTWKQVLRLWVKQAGTWQGVTVGLIQSSGIGKQFYPDTISTVTYPTAGSYSYVVPAGVTQIVTTVVGAGGGGGGSVFSGDGHGAANGGSGGYYTNQTVAVTPGETLSVTVGSGGVGVATGAGTQGGRGGTSSLNRGVTALFEATGGYGGNGVTGDNVPGNTNPPNGSAGGSPNGVAGSYTASWMINRNTNNQGLDGKGENGTGYGTGGLGESAFGIPSTNGGSGFVSIRAVGANFQNYTTPGSYSFVVPAGVTSLTASVYGAGGGAGSIYFCGDGWVGGGGSSGGYYTNQTIAVTPGETLTVVCGAGGAGGYVGGACQSGQNGTAGGSSYVARGGTNLVIATGGGGGGVGLGSNGAAGSPNGVQGAQPCNPGNCGYGFTGNRAGGQNGTGYGNGATAVFAFGTQASGSSGALFLSW